MTNSTRRQLESVSDLIHCSRVALAAYRDTLPQALTEALDDLSTAEAKLAAVLEVAGAVDRPHWQEVSHARA